MVVILAALVFFPLLLQTPTKKARPPRIEPAQSIQVHPPTSGYSSSTKKEKLEAYNPIAVGLLILMIGFLCFLFFGGPLVYKIGQWLSPPEDTNKDS